MNPEHEELRSYLDPIAIRILKKRLVSGEITPQVFKDILKRQMVKYFFQNYRNPLAATWESWQYSVKKRIRLAGGNRQGQGDRFLGHKRF
jgi:hypothetical protein